MLATTWWLTSGDSLPRSRVGVTTPLARILAAFWLASAIAILLVRVGRYVRWRAALERGSRAWPEVEDDVRSVARLMAYRRRRSWFHPW